MNKLFLFVFLLALPVFVYATDTVDINSATLLELQHIVHVGEKIAPKIIEKRPFNSVQDLSKVKGIGNGKYLQDIISQGIACVNCDTSVETTAGQTNTQTPTAMPTPTLVSAPSTAPTPAIIYPTGIFINELMPNPSGPDETNEWAEIFNSNSFDIDLSGWQLQDQQGTSTTYTIPIDTKILASSFFVFKRPDTNIMLNNDSDGLNLLTPDGKTEDSITYTKAPLDSTYNKTDSSWKWSTTATPGSANIITAVATPTKISAKGLSKIKKSDNNKTETAAADLSGAMNPSTGSGQTNPMLLFFIALATAIILAAVTIFIKLKFYKNVRT